jgi:hypothetical protein
MEPASTEPRIEPASPELPALLEPEKAAAAENAKPKGAAAGLAEKVRMARESLNADRAEALRSACVGKEQTSRDKGCHSGGGNNRLR